MRSELIRTLGPTTGECNICGARGVLTEDHVPPKGSPRLGAHELYRIHDALGLHKPADKKGRLFNRGVKHRSICPECNNHLLGARYDPSLIGLAMEVSHHLESVLMRPSIAHIPMRPHLVARSVVGHLLAVEHSRRAAGEMEEAMARYFLDETLNWPDDLRFTSWVYPYRRQVSMRGTGYMRLHTQAHSFFYLLKFYPLAFLISTGGLSPEGDCLQRHFERPMALNDESIFRLRLDTFVHPLWPEAPDDEGMLLMGSGSMVAFDKNAIY